MRTYAETCRYAVEINLINHDTLYFAVAVICDGGSYGGSSYWFTVGHFKTLRGAQRSAVRQMAQLGHEIKFEEIK